MLDSLEPGWIWAIAGILLLIAEVMAPGFFLIFVGIAAILTGLFTLLFGLGLAPQLILFAVYAVLAVMIGKRWYGEPAGQDERHAINDPARRLIGRTVTVVTDVDDHAGRVRVGDGEWNARGGPAAAGERVTVTGVEGNCLIVEPVRTLPPA
jgi:inner membrane protein